MSTDEAIQSRLDRVLLDLTVSTESMEQIRDEFLFAMEKGWASGLGKGASPDESTLKMLTSHVNVFATGKEHGVYYAVDFGGSI